MACLALSSVLETVKIFKNFPDSWFLDSSIFSKDTIYLLIVIINNLLKNNEFSKCAEEENLKIAASEAEYYLQRWVSCFQSGISHLKENIPSDISHLWDGLRMTELLKSLGRPFESCFLKDMSNSCSYIYNGLCYDIFSSYQEGIECRTNIIYTISGREGMGKTVIASYTISCPNLVQKYYPIYVWLDFSKGKQIQVLLQNLLQFVLDCFPYTDAYQYQYHLMSIQELCECISNLLVQCKYIIVIHNLDYRSSIWEEIKTSFPNKDNESKVLLTTSTRQSSECSILKFDLIQLSYDEDGEMFDHLIFGGKPCPPGFKIIRDDILNRCRFLHPITLVVAMYLSSIDQTKTDWLKVKQSIEKNLLRFQDRRSSIVYALLETSIHQDDSKTHQIEGSNQVGTSSDGVGVKESVEELVSQLNGSSKELSVCAILGMAGIGKTTLAKRVYDDPRISMHFDVRAWITVSQSYDERAGLFQLLKCVNKMTNDNIHKDNNELGDILCRSLKRRRYLIVMDDVWGIKAWNDLKRSFPDDKIGSRILMTSREENIIVLPKLGPDYKLNPLSIEKSWDMLQKKVFEHEICPPDLVDIGQQIAKNCKGLPLAIVVIAGILSNINKAMESWKGIAKSVSALVMSDQNSSQTIFNLSYENLSGNRKSCFLYMGAFPRGSEIEVQTLVRLWIAEGFILCEDVGVEHLNYFVDRSLVIAGKRSSNGRLKTCHIHDLLVEFCIQKARKEKFQTVVKDFGEMQLKGRMVDKGCRFSFHFCRLEDAHLAAPLSLAGSALFFGVPSKEIADILLYHLEFKLLHVLDITPLRLDSFPSEQVSKLLLLRYLALTATFELPSLVFKLRKLQTLIVNGPYIMSTKTPVLPPDFWRCTKLKHLQLRISSCLLPPETPTQSVERNICHFFKTYPV